MDRDHSIDRDDLNAIFIILTASVFSLALVALIFLYCKMRCGCCKSKQRNCSNIPHVMITEHRDKTPLSIDCPDIDFIDSKNTNLISSTVQVDSVHQTPSIS